MLSYVIRSRHRLMRLGDDFLQTPSPGWLANRTVWLSDYPFWNGVEAIRAANG